MIKSINDNILSRGCYVCLPKWDPYSRKISSFMPVHISLEKNPNVLNLFKSFDQNPEYFFQDHWYVYEGFAEHYCNLLTFKHTRTTFRDEAICYLMHRLNLSEPVVDINFRELTKRFSFAKDI